MCKRYWLTIHHVTSTCKSCDHHMIIMCVCVSCRLSSWPEPGTPGGVCPEVSDAKGLFLLLFTCYSIDFLLLHEFTADSTSPAIQQDVHPLSQLSPLSPRSPPRQRSVADRNELLLFSALVVCGGRDGIS